jgi:hypothetical protein
MQLGLFLDRVRAEGRHGGTTARKNAEDRSEHGAPQDSRHDALEILAGRHQPFHTGGEDLPLAGMLAQVADDFAITAQIQGYSFPVVIDDSDEMIVVNQFTSSGLINNITKLYFADEDWPTEVSEKPKPNMTLTIDRGSGKERLQIDKVNLESGMWKVDLKTVANTYGI